MSVCKGGGDGSKFPTGDEVVAGSVAGITVVQATSRLEIKNYVAIRPIISFSLLKIYPSYLSIALVHENAMVLIEDTLYGSLIISS